MHTTTVLVPGFCSLSSACFSTLGLYRKTVNVGPYRPGKLDRGYWPGGLAGATGQAEERGGKEGGGGSLLGW